MSKKVTPYDGDEEKRKAMEKAYQSFVAGDNQPLPRELPTSLEIFVRSKSESENEDVVSSRNSADFVEDEIEEEVRVAREVEIPNQLVRVPHGRNLVARLCNAVVRYFRG